MKVDEAIEVVAEEYAKICQELNIYAGEESMPIGNTGKSYRYNLIIYEDITAYIGRTFIGQCAALSRGNVPTVQILGALMKSCTQDAYLNSPLTLFIVDMANDMVSNTIHLKLKIIQGRLESILNPNLNVTDDEIREFINKTIRVTMANGLVMLKYIMSDGGLEAYKQATESSHKLLNQWIDEADDQSEEQLVRLMYKAPLNKEGIDLVHVDLERYYELCDKFIW